jgi:hypothetical protein
MKNPTAIVKTVLPLISLLLLPAPVSAQGDEPVVHKLAPALQ